MNGALARFLSPCLVLCAVLLAGGSPRPGGSLSPAGTARAPTAPAPGDVVVTEIQFAPSPSTNEFVEILNVSTRTVDLQSVTLADGNARPDPLADGPTPLPPGGRAVAVRDPAAFADAFPGVPFLAPAGWEALNNGGDVVLLQTGSTVLDSVAFDDAWASRDGASLERIDPAAPSAAFNFASSTAPQGATPGRRNSVFAPDREPPTPVFADVRLAGPVEVVFSEPLDPATVPEIRVDLDGVPADEVQLVEPAILAVETAGRDRPVRATVTGARDRSGNAASAASVPVARPPDPDEVAINELMIAPRADDFDDRPNQVEYVEVRNRTEDLLSLRAWMLTDRPREDGTADTLRVGRRAGLPPAGWAVLFAAPTAPAAPETASLLARAFPEAPLGDAGVVLLPVERSALGLRNDEDVVRLHRGDGTVLDAVAYEEGWHADALVDPTGTSLERISTEAPAASADNWTSSAHPSGGTPGAVNGAAAAPADVPAGGVTVTPSPFSVERDRALRIRYALEAPVSVLRVRIFDARGRLVRTLADARLSGRQGEIVWDGRGDGGRSLRVGIYVVLVDAVDASGGLVERYKRPVVLARPLGG